MELKKKLQYFLKNHGIVSNMVILFMLVLGLQMIFSPISYARTTLTDDEAEILFNQCCVSSGDYYASNLGNFNSSSSLTYKSTLDISNLSYFKNYFNENNTLEIDPNKTLFIIVQSGLWCHIYYGNFNNGKNSDLPHLNLSYRSYNANYRASCYFQAINDNKSALSYSIKDFRFNKGTLSSLTNISISDYTMQPLSFSGYQYFPDSTYNSSNFSQGINVLTTFQGLVSFSPTNSIYSNMNGSFSFGTVDSVFIPYLYGQNASPIPDIPSGDSSGESSGDIGSGTITNPSGEITGNIDLSGIENGIGTINNNLENIENKIPSSGDISNIISGEVGKITDTLTSQPNLSGTVITSGDIEGSLNFDFMADPYENFWFSMTTGLSGALTNTVRQIPINWLGYQGVFDLDALDFNYPTPLKNILTAISTVSMVWLLVKWWKIIVDKLTSGDIDEVLQMNEEEGIVDLF